MGFLELCRGKSEMRLLARDGDRNGNALLVNFHDMSVSGWPAQETDVKMDSVCVAWASVDESDVEVCHRAESGERIMGWTVDDGPALQVGVD
jgi:hypothetical protein